MEKIHLSSFFICGDLKNFCPKLSYITLKLLTSGEGGGVGVCLSSKTFNSTVDIVISRVDFAQKWVFWSSIS